MKAKVEEFAPVELKSDLASGLNDKEKELVKIFFQIGKITDDLFWKQTFGDKSLLDTISDNYAKDFAMIHYGVWDRLDNNKPFIEGYGEKLPMCNRCLQPALISFFAASAPPWILSHSTDAVAVSTYRSTVMTGISSLSKAETSTAPLNRTRPATRLL